MMLAALLLAFIPGVASLPAAAGQNTADGLRLTVLQPAGFGGRLVATGFTIGKVIRTADGGQVFGFDVDRSGSDGLLSSGRTIDPQGHVRASVETFDQVTGKVTKTIVKTLTMDDFVTEGIFAGDVGLVLHEHVVNQHNTRSFHILNPVTGQKFTGTWTPRNGSTLLLQQAAVNQKTRTALFLGNDFSNNVFVFTSDVAANTFGRTFQLDPNAFSPGDQPQLAQDYAHNFAVLATSPDGGAVGGALPVIATVNLATGKMRSFNGVNTGIFHSGFVNGLAVDPATRIACTSTELDADVEFYDLVHETGFAVGLPGANGNQGATGEAVVADPLHKLFLVAQPNGTVGPAGGSVVDVFDESGHIVKSITGFKSWSVTPQMVVNPAKRTGFIQGPSDNAITEFTY